MFNCILILSTKIVTEEQFEQPQQFLRIYMYKKLFIKLLTQTNISEHQFVFTIAFQCSLIQCTLHLR